MGNGTSVASSSTGSGAVRKSLGRQLKALREQAGKTPADVHALKLASRDKLWRIEKGKGPVKEGDVLALCRLYKVSAEETDALVELAHKTNVEGFWEAYSDLMPPRFGVYLEMEAAASHVRMYEPELVYGLLQTPAYYRAVAEADGLAPEAIERQVVLRAERQRAAFDREVPLKVVVILGEGVLCRKVGGDAVMSEQRRHLLEMSRRPNVQVFVLRWDAGAHGAMRGAFFILSFEEDPETSDVVFLETLDVGRYEERPSMVSEYRARFGALQPQSITIEEYLT